VEEELVALALADEEAFLREALRMAERLVQEMAVKEREVLVERQVWAAWEFPRWEGALGNGEARSVWDLPEEELARRLAGWGREEPLSGIGFRVRGRGFRACGGL
jgi:hypothetical protein